MTVKKVLAIIEGMAFAFAIALALGLGSLAGLVAYNDWLAHEPWWDWTIGKLHIPEAAGDWLGQLSPFIFIAPTVFFSTVAIGLWTGWRKSGKNRGLAWMIVISMNLVLFGLYGYILLSSLGEWPAS